MISTLSSQTIELNYPEKLSLQLLFKNKSSEDEEVTVDQVNEQEELRRSN